MIERRLQQEGSDIMGVQLGDQRRHVLIGGTGHHEQPNRPDHRGGRREPDDRGVVPPEPSVRQAATGVLAIVCSFGIRRVKKRATTASNAITESAARNPSRRASVFSSTIASAMAAGTDT